MKAIGVDPPQCKSCDEEYTVTDSRLIYEHGMCDQCAAAELDDHAKALATASATLRLLQLTADQRLMLEYVRKEMRHVAALRDLGPAERLIAPLVQDLLQQLIDSAAK